MPTPPETPAAETETKEEPKEKQTKFGRFIEKYHGVLSSFVIGAAGLVATSVWQYKQSEIAKQQAESQQRVAETQAENSWKIEKAEILAKNLQTLSTQGEANVEQRYGVLLSLSRGNLIDPELTVSYALELGKDSPEYMRSVLADAADKNYVRLSSAFAPTCLQRYGVFRLIDACKDDKLADRSAALAALVSDEVTARFSGTLDGGASGAGPLSLLQDEKQVQQQLVPLVWLFAPLLTGLYEHRKWADIDKFEATSQGARLVSSLILAAARTGELVTTDEAAQVEQFHAARRKWLASYLVGTSCDNDCKGQLVDVMLTQCSEAKGDYDQSIRTLLERPPVESASAMTRLHSRILWCKVEEADEKGLRDGILIPTITELASKNPVDEKQLDDVLSLFALTYPPDADDAGWKAASAALQKAGERYTKLLADRRALAKHDRVNPPPAMKANSFCNAPPPPAEAAPMTELTTSAPPVAAPVPKKRAPK